jgi:hypothetical protein
MKATALDKTKCIKNFCLFDGQQMENGFHHFGHPTTRKYNSVYSQWQVKHQRASVICLWTLVESEAYKTILILHNQTCLLRSHVLTVASISCPFGTSNLLEYFVSVKHHRIAYDILFLRLHYAC